MLEWIINYRRTNSLRHNEVDQQQGLSQQPILYFKRVEDILLDDNFYKWYLQTDLAEVKRWNTWRLSDKRNNDLLEEAVHALHCLNTLQDEYGFPKKVHAISSRLEKAALVKQTALV